MTVTMNRVRFERFLRKAGFKLTRSTKHHIWKHPDGRSVSVSKGTHTIYLSQEQEREYNRIRGVKSAPR